jgi:hypothetical protein
MKKFLLAAIAVVALTGSVEAQSGGAYHTLGQGSVPCSAWASARVGGTGGASVVVEQWILGFLSGVGFVGPLDPLQSVANGQAVFAWIDNYYRANPLKNLSNAAAAFVEAHPH